ncbi:MAG: hypothetical protein EOO16_00370 [Chitinophagaceae bacterium]|nr:MAG: hypothetical protein EOO16_00370 [Chitinophagaceae bacterium]
MKYLFSVLFMFMSVVGSTQSTWERFAKGEGVEFYYSPSRTTRDGSVITVWMKTIETGKKLIERRAKLKKQNPKKSLLYARYGYEVEKRELDCTSKRFRFVSNIRYTTDGKVIESVEFDEETSGWIEAVPESYGEGVLNALCDVVE